MQNTRERVKEGEKWQREKTIKGQELTTEAFDSTNGVTISL